MHISLRLFLVLLLLWQFHSSSCQDYVADIESYTVESGLSQSTVNVIFQDSRGYLWVGTQDGLNRYDGYNFKTYAPQAYNKYSISSNFINCITEDKNGNLWIGTHGGLNLYVFKEDKFYSFRHDPKNIFSIASDEVLGLNIDRNGNFWVKTLETLDRLDVSKGHFFHYPYYNNIFNFYNDQLSFPIIEDKSGKLWIGTKDGLNYFDRSLLLFDRQSQSDKDAKLLLSDYITSMCETKNGNFWIGTKKGLFLFDSDKKLFSQPGYLKSLGNKRIYSLLADNNGKLWIGEEDGIELIDCSSLEHNKVILNDVEKKFLLKAQIISLFEDKSGIIWIGTNRGLLKINIRPKRFKLLSRASQPSVSLSSDDISAFYQQDKNTLWIGTWGGGLNILDIANGNLRKFDLSKQENNENWNYIHCIYKDILGKYFLGTRDGVLYFDMNKGEAVNLCSKYKINNCQSIKGNRISQIIDDNSGNLWFSSYFGLHKLNAKKDNITSWLHSPDDTASMPSNIFYCIQKSSEGIFWLGTEKGIVKFDPYTESILQKSRVIGNEPVLNNTPVYSLLVDENSKTIWAGSATGLIKFDDNCRVIKCFTQNDGLSGNLIYALQKDNYNNIWLSTNHGINKFNIRNESFTNFDLADGLQNYEFNLGASLKAKDGSFYFGGISGINLIKPDSIAQNSAIPQIVLTNIELIDKKGIRSNIQPNGKSLTLSYGTYLLTIDFAALDYSYPYKNRFKYKFYNDEETGWIYLGNKHAATFTNLKPGKYTFKLIGSNSDMTWNEKGLEYEIIVESPFWLTTLAFYLYGFIGVLLFYIIYQLRTIQLHKTNKLLKHQEIVAREMLRQKEELSIKNKNITDSINYAKRIQEALMPSEKQIRRAFPKSFVLHKPKDIVSGDFFWISERGDKILVAAIDCTGHGVPGAFMSIIGYELFRKITNNVKIGTASEMLTSLNQEFESIFKDVDNFTLRDGMDIAFIVIDKKNRNLEFSGAINPMYLIRNNKIHEIRGSRFSIGIDENIDQEQTFENNLVSLEEDDVVYLFSDGYADQFGGPEGKKFKYRRFRHLLLTIHRFPLEEQQHLLEDRFESWKGNLEQVDDILVIGIKPFSK
jgi:ligand-binding sensor domain-containing protein/serine phosphatase RsbU (regulator of sigma subunit)